jgi:hypothetical protein
MANKVHTISIGGKERTLRYSFGSFREFGKRAEAILGHKGANWFEWVAVDNPEMWAVVVCYALTHEVRDLTVDRVSTWFDEMVKDDLDIRPAAIWPAQRALGESGVCGRKWTIEENGKFIWLDEDASGKDSAAGL